MSAAVAEEYMSSLLELTFNSKPHIQMLTMLAEDYHSEALSIVHTIETHLSRTQGERLPILYLIDSIVKNVGKDYVQLFSRNLPTLFASVFEKANESMRSNMYKLRATWESIFSIDRLAILDTLVNDIDPRWPVVRPPQPTNIHINPEFFKGGLDRRAAVRGDVRERILQEQKVLLELQKKKVELEILQTKEVLEKKEKNLESITTTIRGDNKLPPLISDQKTVPTVKETNVPLPGTVRDVESENTKKLLEVSLKDPRRKYRQTDRASDSPLSGTSSPIPSRSTSKQPYVSSSSPSKSYSDDSRDRPPKKKQKSKDKKRPHGDKESVRENKKSYVPKVSEGGRKKNGHSHKYNSRGHYSDVETRLPNSNESLIHTDGSDLSNVPFPSSPVKTLDKKTLDNYGSISEQITPDESIKTTNEAVDKSISQVSVRITKGSTTDTIEPLSSQIDTGKPTIITSKPQDPRLSKETAKLPFTESKKHSKETSDAGKNTINNLTGNSDEASSKISKSLAVIEPFEDMGGTDSVSDLISTLSSFDEYDGKPEVEVGDTLSHDSSLSVTRSSGEVPSSFSIEDVKSDSASLSDICSPSSNTTSQVGASKRKVETDEDREDRKKIILSEDHGSSGGTENLQFAVSSIVNSPKNKEELSMDSLPSCIETPPSPPCIVPNVIKKDSDLKEGDTSQTPNDIPVNQYDSSSSLPIMEKTKEDTDLRLLLPMDRSRPNVAEEVQEEKKEVETTSLFGVKDVDYRQKPPPQPDFSLPSPPPPPVIGNLQEATAKKSWAQIKDKRSEERSSPKVKPAKLTKRSSLSQWKQDEELKDPPLASCEDRCNLLIKQAEEQLRNGNITFVEYNKMLQEVVSINEERILKETRAKYSKTSPPENKNSPLSPSNFDDSFDLKRQQHPEHSDRPRIEHFENRLEPPAPRIGVSMMQSRDSQEPFTRDRFDYSDKVMWGDRLPPPPNIVERYHRPMAGPPIQAPPFPPFPGNNMPFHPNFRPRMSRDVIPTTYLPTLSMDMTIDTDPDSIISIGDGVKQVRFYGRTAVVLLSCDNPREISFPPGKRYLMVDKHHEFQLQFGSPPTEIIIDDKMSLVQLGVPLRELYIDNSYWSMQFGGMPIDVNICGRIRSICLSGPSPIVRYSPVKCTHLVAGTVNLFINAKSKLLFFLDGKPQTFYIDRERCVLKFADSLMTVLINGVPVPLAFGGNPVPIMLRGMQHFLRLSALPVGIMPGQVNIMNMDSFAFPPKILPPPIPMSISDPYHTMFIPQHGNIMAPMPDASQQPLDLLSSVMDPPTVTTSDERSYSIEQPAAPPEAPPEYEQQTTVPSTTDTSNININDLFQKLLQTGLLHNTSTEQSDKKKVEEIDVDFSRPETLKLGRPSLVTKLYSGIQCSSCGIRFPPEGTKMYSRHLDWHFRQNRREKHSTRKPQSRRWYYDLSDWIQYQELDDIDETEPEPVEEEGKGEGEDSGEDMPSVPVGHRKDVICQVCGEKFEEFYNHETEEWHARNAILVEDLFYHPLCYEEFKLKKESGVIETDDKMEEEEPPPAEDSSTVEVIDLDETDTAVPSPIDSSNTADTLLPLLGPEKPESPDIIALDDNSDSKSEDRAKDAVESDDDDILGIEVIERKIESYELLDDEEEEAKITGETEEDIKKGDEEEEKEDFDFSKVTIKQEKDRDRLVVESADSSQPTYTATIDGNIVHETAAPLVVPGRIKINIHRSAKSGATGDVDIIEPSTDSNDALVLLSQPPPPGEDSSEPPQSVKTKLIGVEFTPQPPVNQGSELSGLCSIM